MSSENPEDDTGILVAYLNQTLEESRRLREDLTQEHPDTHAPEPLMEQDGVTSPDPLSQPD